MWNCDKSGTRILVWNHAIWISFPDAHRQYALIGFNHQHVFDLNHHANLPLLCAAHPFSVLAAPSQLTHPSMSLPQLPISRWPPLSQFLTSPLWCCENKWTKNLRVGRIIWDSNPRDFCFFNLPLDSSLWDCWDKLWTRQQTAAIARESRICAINSVFSFYLVFIILKRHNFFYYSPSCWHTKHSIRYLYAVLQTELFKKKKEKRVLAVLQWKPQQFLYRYWAHLYLYCCMWLYFCSEKWNLLFI